MVAAEAAARGFRGCCCSPHAAIDAVVMIGAVARHAAEASAAEVVAEASGEVSAAEAVAVAAASPAAEEADAD